MIKTFGKITLAGVLAAMMMGTAARVSAADATNAPAAPRPRMFRGTLAAADAAAKTITVDNKTEKGRVFQITSDTKITKAGKPATLSDGVVGEAVSGSYTTGAEGKMEAKMVRFGSMPKKPAPAN